MDVPAVVEKAPRYSSYGFNEIRYENYKLYSYQVKPKYYDSGFEVQGTYIVAFATAGRFETSSGTWYLAAPGYMQSFGFMSSDHS